MPLPAGVSQGNPPCFTPAQHVGDGLSCGRQTGASRGARASHGTDGDRNAELRRGSHLADGAILRWSTVLEQPVMANVLNPETESITLNTQLETPTLDPATEPEALPSIDRLSRESTSNLPTSNIDNSEVVDASPLDADALTEPVAQAATLELPSPTE